MSGLTLQVNVLPQAVLIRQIEFNYHGDTVTESRQLILADAELSLRTVVVTLAS